MRFTLLHVILLLATPTLNGAEPLQAQRGKLLFQDDFSGEDLGDWKSIIPDFRVVNGVLTAQQQRDDHGAVGRVYLPMKDVVMRFRFRFRGSPRFNLVFDDRNHRESHAGHICRVAFSPVTIRLGDDKEGAMRNDLFKMRRNPATKDKAAQLLRGRSTSVDVKSPTGAWHQAEVVILGNRMSVKLDEKMVAELASPGIAHPTKTSVHFTVVGKAMEFDDVQIWSATKP